MSDLVFPFTSKEFMQAWELWLAYRKEIRKPIRGKISAQGQLRKISRLADGNEQYAIAVIEQSIENSWQGLFPVQNFKTISPNEQLTREIKNRYSVN